MKSVRLFRCLVAPALAALPTFVLWLVMQPLVRSPVTVVDSPNPSKAPAAFLSPFEVLVYAEPWYAGVGTWWLVLGAALITIVTIAAVVSAVKEQGEKAVAAVAFLAGVLFAAPWIHGLFHLLTRG